jgi:molybdenum cofactor biosynthesis enzyme MoaA
MLCKGIFSCLDNGIDVKINVVLSNFFSFFDFENFYSLLKYKNLTIRFIDQMETLSVKEEVMIFILVLFI